MHPGNNAFWCGGRIIAGPSPLNALGTGLAVLIPTVMFMIGPAAHLQDAMPSTWPIRLVATVTGCLSLCALATAHCMDPGILPRGNPRDRLREGPWRICSTCNIYKPPRSHHCRDCDNCVAVFDHHCPWLGNCVAHRNYLPFVMFVTVTWVHDVFVACCTIYYVMFGDESGETAAQNYTSVPRSYSGSSGRSRSQYSSSVQPGYPEALLLIVFCAIVLLPLWSLCGYHLVLISNGETTKERIQHKKASASIRESTNSPELGPQSEAAAGVVSRRNAKEARDAADAIGCVGHWLDIMCKPPPPSQLPPLRALVKDVEAEALRKQEEGALAQRSEDENWENGPTRSDSGRDLTAIGNPVASATHAPARNPMGVPV